MIPGQFVDISSPLDSDKVHLYPAALSGEAST